MKIVYLDTVFVINLLSDFILLHLTSRFLLINTTIKRMLLSSLVGAIFSCVAAVFVVTQMLVFLLSLLIMYTMCRIGLPTSKYKAVVQQIATMYIFSNILCGTVSLVDAVVNPRANSDINSIVIMLCSVLVLCLSKIISPFYRKRMYIKQVKATVVLDDNVYNLSLLCDNGNLLTDNVSSLPVMIVNIDDKLVKNIYPIIIKTVAGEKMLWCKVPKKVTIEHENTYREIKCCVAFANEMDFRGFDGIVPECVLENL